MAAPPGAASRNPRHEYVAARISFLLADEVYRLQGRHVIDADTTIMRFVVEAIREKRATRSPPGPLRGADSSEGPA